jgi:hypothetical protein
MVCILGSSYTNDVLVLSQGLSAGLREEALHMWQTQGISF